MTRLEVLLLAIAGLGIIYMKIYNPAVYSDSACEEFDHATHIANTRKLENFYLKQVVTLKQQVEEMIQKNREVEGDLLELFRNVSNYEKQIMGTNYALNQQSNNIKSCREVPRSGWYWIDVSDSTSIRVYCEQRMFGGGWILIQNRFDGSVSFYRNWDSYREAFGFSDGEFWLGLDNIHKLTSLREYELLVYLTDFYGNWKYAMYDKFAIGNETEWYYLKTLGSFSGTAGDSLGYHRGQNFSTSDVDNDKSSSHNCAVLCRGAWWYRSCDKSNLNGMYKETVDRRTMNWFNFNNDHQGLASSKMLIRERQ